MIISLVFLVLLQFLISPCCSSNTWGSTIATEQSVLPMSLVFDSQDNLIVVGIFGSSVSTATFFNSSGNVGAVLRDMSYMRGFVAKYSNTGGLLWSAALDGNEITSLQCQIDSTDSIIITGEISANQKALLVAYSSSRSSSISRQGLGGTDTFIVKYTSSGSVHSAIIIGTLFDDSMGHFAIDNDDDSIIGTFSFSTSPIFKHGINGVVSQLNTSDISAQYYSPYNLIVKLSPADTSVIWKTPISGCALKQVHVTQDSVYVNAKCSVKAYISPQIQFNGMVKENILLVKYSKSNDGLNPVWAIRVTTDIASSNQLTVDPSGNSILVASSYNYVGVRNHTGSLLFERSNLDWSNVIFKFSKNGQCLWFVHVKASGFFTEGMVAFDDGSFSLVGTIAYQATIKDSSIEQYQIFPFGGEGIFLLSFTDDGRFERQNSYVADGGQLYVNGLGGGYVLSVPNVKAIAKSSRNDIAFCGNFATQKFTLYNASYGIMRTLFNMGFSQNAGFILNARKISANAIVKTVETRLEMLSAVSSIPQDQVTTSLINSLSRNTMKTSMISMATSSHLSATKVIRMNNSTTSLSTPSSSNQRGIPSLLNSETVNVVTFGVAAGLLFLFFLTAVIIDRWRKSKRRTLSKSNISSRTDLKTFSSNNSLARRYEQADKSLDRKINSGSSNMTRGSMATDQSISTNNTVSSIATLKGNAGACIPGFLMFQHGLDFRLEDQIDKGGSASIHSALAYHPQLKKYGNKIVIKEFKSIIVSKYKIQGFYQETSIMYLLREHKNIARFLGYSEKPYCILMKYYPDGNLITYLLSNQTVKYKRLLLRFTKNIARGISHFASKGIAHCDLKTANILIDIDKKKNLPYCVITDFGIARFVNETSLNVKNFNVIAIEAASIHYASPESIAHLKFPNIRYPFKYDPLSSDIYSFSAAIYEIMTRIEFW